MNSKPTISYISQFIIFWGLVAGCLFLASFAGLVIWMSMTGGGFGTMQKDMLNPANADAVKVLQLVSSSLTFLLPALIFARIVNKQPLRHLGLRTRFNWTQLGLAAVTVFVAFYLSGALAELTNQIPISAKLEKKFREMEKIYTEQVMVIANMKNLADYFYTLIVIAVAPAIFEELLFRGALQPLMVKWTRIAWLGILITSLVFSAVHFSYYGFLSRVALGLILGYMYHYSNSMWLPMIAHFINNGFAVTMMYYMKQQGKLDASALDEKFPIWWGVLAAAVIFMLFVVFRNESRKYGNYYIDNTATKSDDPFEEQEQPLT